MTNLTLNKKSCWVTGGTKGLGKAFTETLVKEGAKVAICGRDTNKGEKVAEEISAKYDEGEVFFHKANVKNPEEIRAFAKAVRERYGNVKIAVNNAGVFPFTPALEVDLEEWQDVLNTNLTGVFLCCQFAAEQMIDSNEGGKIINLSSPTSYIARPGLAAYSASKAGINALTRVLAIELAEHDITVNTLCPGLIKTDGVMAGINTPEDKEELQDRIKRTPLNKSPVPERVIGGLRFLVSEDSNYVTGHTLVIDGGYSAGKLV